MARQWKTIIMLFSDMILFYALRKEKRRKKYLHFAISWNILWRFWYLFQIFCSSELFCKSAWGMSFAFHEELHLKTLKVYNHPIEKCYNSVFQKQAPCKSDKKKGCLVYYVTWNQTDISVGAPDNRTAKRHLCIIKTDAIVLVHKYRKNTYSFYLSSAKTPPKRPGRFYTWHLIEIICRGCSLKGGSTDIN